MKKVFLVLSVLMWLGATAYLHILPRTSFGVLWGWYSLAFVAYFYLVNRSTLSLTNGLLLALLIRLVGFFSSPHLSDDYYRYIWDGAVTSAGMHPMAYTPGELNLHPEWLDAPPDFFEHLNSPSYHAVYPPVLQSIFHAAFILNGWDIRGHVLFYKIILFVVDFLLLWLLFLILKQKKKSPRWLLMYALNPLIILEFTGNLHFDSLMILALLAGLYFFEKNKIWAAGISMALSILTKLITAPLLLFFWTDKGWKKWATFSGSIGLLTLLVFFWRLGTDLHWLQSIGLWFQHFEFNASVYYILRGVGFWLVGYNAIAWIGPGLACLTIVGMLWIGVLQRQGKIKSMEKAMLLAMTLYLLMSTTIHPWYVAIILVLGILSGARYPIVWSYLIYLSYSHYAGGLFKENYALITVEYVILGLFMIYGRRLTSIVPWSFVSDEKK